MDTNAEGEIMDNLQRAMGEAEWERRAAEQQVRDDRLDHMLDLLEDYETTCPDCDGDGVILVCCDDICNGIGHCMHGDGEMVCATCGGTGEVSANQNYDGDEVL